MPCFASAAACWARSSSHIASSTCASPRTRKVRRRCISKPKCASSAARPARSISASTTQSSGAMRASRAAGVQPSNTICVLSSFHTQRSRRSSGGGGEKSVPTTSKSMFAGSRAPCSARGGASSAWSSSPSSSPCPSDPRTSGSPSRGLVASDTPPPVPAFAASGSVPTNAAEPEIAATPSRMKMVNRTAELSISRCRTPGGMPRGRVPGGQRPRPTARDHAF